MAKQSDPWDWALYALIAFLIVCGAGGVTVNNNRSEDPCPAAGCKRVPNNEPSVDGTLPPGLDK